MTTSIIDAETVLALDLGSLSTRAFLFDVVDGQYRFIARGTAPTTITAPFRDVLESVHKALQHLGEITGRVLTDEGGNLIIPTQSDGSGVDRLVTTYSAGPEAQLVVAGLLSDVSLESAQRLAASCYGRVVETIGLNDRRPMAVQLDAILAAQPDIVILAGGTDKGASRSVLKLVELVLMACRVLPQDHRPQVLYAGNQVLGKKIKDALEKWTAVKLASNVRPSIDQEDIGPAQEALSQIFTELAQRNLGGLHALGMMSSVPPSPSAQAFGRMVRFFSQGENAVKGVLGVDLGASSTVVASAFAGHLSLDVFPLGMGKGLSKALQGSDLRQITQWIPMHVPEVVVRDYLWQKSLFPSTVPITTETLAIEQAMTRYLIHLVVDQSIAHWPNPALTLEPILASGSSVSQAATPAQSLMMILDGVQPLGITTVFLDQNGLAASLGAIARFNSVLPVQVIDSGVFLNLGTVICPVSSARYGTPILKIRVEYAKGEENQLEVRQGQLVSLPLHTGQVANVKIQAMHNTEVDPRGKHSGDFQIVGGVCGAVIDARGRPLTLPPDDSRRREMIKKWNLALGG